MAGVDNTFLYFLVIAFIIVFIIGFYSRIELNFWKVSLKMERFTKDERRLKDLERELESQKIAFHSSLYHLKKKLMLNELQNTALLIAMNKKAVHSYIEKKFNDVLSDDVEKLEEPFETTPITPISNIEIENFEWGRIIHIKDV